MSNLHSAWPPPSDIVSEQYYLDVFEEGMTIGESTWGFEPQAGRGYNKVAITLRLRRISTSQWRNMSVMASQIIGNSIVSAAVRANNKENLNITLLVF